MDFVIIANQWDAFKANPTSKHHIAMELVKKGHRVLWVVGSGMRTPSILNKADRGRVYQKLINAFNRTSTQVSNDAVENSAEPWVIAPLIIPLPGLSFARWVNERIYVFSMLRMSRRLGFEEPVLINFLPIIPGVYKKWTGKKVYYCVDKWSAFDEYDAELMDRLDAECCSNADIVIASARELEERCRNHNKNTHLLLHGVDYEHFFKSISRTSLPRTTREGLQGGAEGAEKKRPEDLPEGRVVGFFGLISEWVDQELLIQLARKLNHKDEGGRMKPEGKDGKLALNECNTSDRVSVVLIGKADVDVSRLEAEENIHLLGQKSYKELPQYLAYFDVGMIPFKINELTKAVNPIKLREMLAGGCRVVSTGLPEVKDFAHESGLNNDMLSIGGNSDEFIQTVTRWMKEPLCEEDKKKMSESMVQETWTAKVEHLLEVIS